jgi:UDP-N-acetylglucosamine 2-epimerase
LNKLLKKSRITQVDKTVNNTKEILDNPNVYNTMIAGKNPFGNGDASFKILEVLLNNIK